LLDERGGANKMINREMGVRVCLVKVGRKFAAGPQFG